MNFFPFVVEEKYFMDDVWWGQVLRFTLLHGSNPFWDDCLLLPLMLAFTSRLRRLGGLRKEIMGTKGIAFLHRSELCRMGKRLCNTDPMLGRAGV